MLCVELYLAHKRQVTCLLHQAAGAYKFQEQKQMKSRKQTHKRKVAPISLYIYSAVIN